MRRLIPALALAASTDALAFTPDSLWWTASNGDIWTAPITRDGTGMPTGLGTRTKFATVQATSHTGIAFYGNNLYSVNRNTGTILRFDSTATSTTWATGLPNSGLGAVGAIAFDSSGYLFVGAPTANQVYMVGPSGGAASAVLSSTDGVSAPWFLTVDPVNGRLWVASSNAGKLHSYDRRTSAKATVTTGQATDGGLAHDCAASHLIGANHFGRSVFTANKSTGAAVTVLSGLNENPEGMVRDDRGWFYTGLNNGSIVRLRADGTSASTIAVVGHDVDALTWFGSATADQGTQACGAVLDSDADGVPDSKDNCATVANATQANADGDALGDACDGCTDVDGDTYGTTVSVTPPAPACAGVDCDDTKAAIRPGATEVVGDGIDQDCSGADRVACFTDLDDDEFGTSAAFGEGTCGTKLATVAGDCDDTNAGRSPGDAEIVGDGIDQNCSGADSVACFTDLDDDAFGTTATTGEGSCGTKLATVAGDCDDTRASAFPGGTEVTGDGIDQDCSGADSVACFTDLDDDGHGTTATTGEGACGTKLATAAGDCLDSDATVFPGASETTGDGVDQDCSGKDRVACFTDVDGDDFGAGAAFGEGTCDVTGLALVGGDCDDAAIASNPDGIEIPDDGIDQDCSGADTVSCFVDGDGDGFGVGATTAEGDCASAGHADVGGDCDDQDPDAWPGADDVLDDGIDQDCSGLDAVQCYVDGDEDGFGDAEEIGEGDCATDGWVADGGDCDDADPVRFPGAEDIVGDGIDQDCSGADGKPCFVDADDDGFGDEPATGEGDCSAAGLSDADGDCDDDDLAINPDADEIIDDGIDQDCSGKDAVTCYTDGDDDGYGVDPAVGEGNCLGAGLASKAADCDDTDAETHPGADEIPDDGIDQDCSGDDGVVCFRDSDEDGYGAEQVSGHNSCDDADDLSAIGGDCNDDADFVHPDATEVLDDGIDQDCSGWDSITCYADFDEDGFGGSAIGPREGECPDGAVPTPGDCDDSDEAAAPGADETCDGGDDCDATTAPEDCPDTDTTDTGGIVVGGGGCQCDTGAPSASLGLGLLLAGLLRRARRVPARR